MDKKTLKRYLCIILGNILITGAYAFITVPNEIINGGITSFSMILGELFSINMTVFVNAITLFLLLLCPVFLGKEFFLGSLFSCLCYLSLFTFFHSLGTGLSAPPILCAVISGTTVGCGYFLCISAKSTAISFDVIALIINRKNPKLNTAYMMGVINALVLLAGLSVYGPASVLLGLAFTAIQTMILHLLLSIDSRHHT